MMERIVVITSRIPWPLDKGDKLRIYHQIKYLHQHAEVHLFAIGSKPPNRDQTTAIQSICHTFHPIVVPKYKRYINLVGSVFSKTPFQVAYFSDAQKCRHVQQHIRALQPNSIYCHLIRTVKYVKGIPHIPKTLDYMDAFGKGMERRAKTAKGIEKWVYNTEKNRLFAYEKRVFDQFNKHTIISAQDQEHIAHPNAGAIAVIPNGVDTIHWSPRPHQATFDLVFSGNMDYPPNIVAAKYAIRAILPLVHKTLPSATLLIAGRGAPGSLKKLSSEHVTFIEHFADMRESFRMARVNIAPMKISIGLQNKLLQGMALGIPSVTTTLANNALLANPDHEIAIGDNAQELADQIIKLLQNPAYYNTLKQNGRTYIERSFTWDKQNEMLHKLLTETV